MKKFVVMSLWMIFLSSSLTSLSLINVSAQTEPKVNVMYECGTLDVNTQLNANGFEPNSSVSWKVITPTDETGAIFGYFDTNSTGGFKEFTHLSELKDADYSVQFFDDANKDGLPDKGKKIFTAKMSPPVPCK
ncbi:MAG: hypothetical protein ACM3XP_02055 [Nitrososphaerales archaeon]|jgi:hypothetical protein